MVTLLGRRMFLRAIPSGVVRLLASCVAGWNSVALKVVEEGASSGCGEGEIGLQSIELSADR